MKQNTIRFFLFMGSLGTVLWTGCQSENIATPKPRAYPRIEYPTNNQLDSFAENYCQFSFQKPSYARVEQNTTFLNEKPLHPCWFDLIFDGLNGRLHCNYRPINADTLYKAIGDAYELANKHNLKAQYIDELVINNPTHRVYGVIFEIEGAVASPFQFYLTDSTKHFFRGSLYFNSSPNPDSMAPVIAFVKQDIAGMFNTFRWDDY